MSTRNSGLVTYVAGASTTFLGFMSYITTNKLMYDLDKYNDPSLTSLGLAVTGLCYTLTAIGGGATIKSAIDSRREKKLSKKQ